MKTIFEKTVRDELTARINSLQKNRKPAWGKMDVFQMARHCSNWSEWVQGKGNYVNHVYKQDFLGKLFGKMALKSNTKNEKPMGKNMPAGKFAVKITEKGKLETEKSRWIQLLAEYGHYLNDGFVHDFFGKMTKEQIGIFVYKHFDHHLRQFGV